MAQAKKKKKLLMIGALLVVGAVGAVGYQQFMAPVDETEPLPSLPEPGYLHMEALLAPVLEGRRISRYVSIGITLELYDESDKQTIYRYLTPLKSAFIEDLQFQAQLSREAPSPIHLRRIKARFLALSERVLGEEVVKDVLISHALDRGF